MHVREPIPIAFVLNSFDGGGTEHQMTELIRRLDRRIFAVHAACLGDRGTLRARVVAANVPIAEFPMWGFAKPATLVQALRFARWCRIRRIQIVQACDFYSNIFAVPAAAFARVPVRIGSRRDLFVPERGAAHRRLQHLSYQFAHRIVANSAAATNQLVSEGIDPASIALIPNGLDPERFPLHVHVSAHAVVTTVANLRPGKGHEVLLEAAARVLGRLPEVRFQIVGDGPRRQALEQHAARLGIADRVRFTGQRDDVSEVLQQSDVFAFPSLMEASPNAVLEAMAAGIAVVASDVGGIPEAIAHRDSGLLVPAGNAEALSEAILELLERPALRAQLGASARQTAHTRFSFDKMTASFQALYLSQLSERAPSRRGPSHAAAATEA